MSKKNSMGSVYISYPHDDYAALQAMVQMLKDHYEVRYDQGFGVGKRYRQELENNLDDSDAYICIMNENYVKAPSCMHELNLVLNHLNHKKIIFAYVGNKNRVINGHAKGMQLLLKAMPSVEVGEIGTLYDNHSRFIDLIDNDKLEKPIVEFGRYMQQKPNVFERLTGSILEGGKTPIEWLALEREGNSLLLISKYALDCKRYNEKSEPVTWETCTLRKWLNEEFLGKAFTKEQQQMIETTAVKAEKNPRYDTDPGNDTEDKVFLLSVQEAEKYFASDKERICKLTPHMKEAKFGMKEAKFRRHQEKYLPYVIEAAALIMLERCYWWLRSPGDGQRNAAFVSKDFRSFGWSSVFADEIGVRPACRINLESYKL